MTVAAPETAPGDAVPDVLEPGDGGVPTDPQPCQLGEHPAVKSLLFQEGAAYTPTCLEHEEELRAQLEAAGETISGEVEIEDTEPVGGAETSAMAADTATLPDTPLEVVEETEGEMRVRFPVLVLENAETDDGRFIEAGALTHRALPLTLLALPESSHGGADPGASVVIGRLDSMTRTPGPDVIAPSTGEAFPEGVWVWSAEGSIDANHPVADMVRRRFLRGVSVDLVGMDYEIEGGEAFDAEGEDVSTPERIRVSKASVAAATIVPIPAYADAYVELSGDTAPVLPSEPLHDGLVASAVPSWRSSEVGDSVPALTAAGDEPHTGGMIALVPRETDELIVSGGEPAEELHLTLAYLGDDVTSWSEEQRAEVLAGAEKIATGLGRPTTAEVMGHAAFNPTGANDREPCAVYLVSGEELPQLKADASAFDVSEHPVFFPHITAGYGLSPADLSYIGPVTFDRVRVALGAEVTDFPMGDGTADGEEPTEPEEGAMADVGETSEVGDLPEPPDEVGTPDAPQPCEFGPEPAVMSLLFGDGMYTPVCAEHRADAEATIAEMGEEVTDVVEIQPGTDETAEEVV